MGVERTCRLGVMLQRLYLPLLLRVQTKGGARREGPGECLAFKVVLSFPNDNTRSQLSISPLTI